MGLSVDVGKVVLEPDAADCAVCDLHPFMDIDHIGDAVFHPERAVDGHHVRRHCRVRGESVERTLGRIRPEDLRASHDAPGAVPVAPLLRKLLAGVEGAEDIVFAVVAVELRRPDAVDFDVAPEIVGSGVDDGRPLPVLEVGAFVAHDAAPGRADEVVGVRCGVGEDAVVPPSERVGFVHSIREAARPLGARFDVRCQHQHSCKQDGCGP